MARRGRRKSRRGLIHVIEDLGFVLDVKTGEARHPSGVRTDSGAMMEVLLCRDPEATADYITCLKDGIARAEVGA